MSAEANRRALHERLRRSGYEPDRDWANRQPIVPVEMFLADGVTEWALRDERVVRFGAERFRALLLSIERRDDVSDVAFECDADLDEPWPGWDYLFIATSCDRDEVAAWFDAVPPDLIVRADPVAGWVKARVIRVEELTIAPGHRLWGLRWMGWGWMGWEE